MNILDSIKREPIPWIIGAVFVLVTTGGTVALSKLTRGLRNNNPGNIRRGQPWLGLRDIQTDSAFDQFIFPEWGIRALVIVLRNYASYTGTPGVGGSRIDTVQEIINRWAPPSENQTGSYVNAVAKALGVAPTQPIDVNAHMSDLVRAIIKHENGLQPYESTTIQRGIALANSAQYAAAELAKDKARYA